MKSTRIFLLVLGLLGIAAAIFGMVNGDDLMDQLITIVCSASLIFGYYHFGKETEKKD